MSLLLILAILWPALAGVIVWLLPAAGDRRLRGMLNCGALGIELLLVILLCAGQGTGLVLLQMTPSLQLLLRVDAVGCLFAVLMSFMWLVGSIYALEYMDHSEHERSYQAFYMCVLSALVGQCYAGSMIAFYIFYELMTLLSVPMVVHERTPQAVAAGIKYLVYSIFGAMMGLLGIFFFQHYLGTVNFTAGGVAAATGAPAGLLVITFLVIMGFGTKAGLFPLHGWLPTAHPVAPAPASAVLSGVITKAGVLAIVRVIYFLIGPQNLQGTWVQRACLILALITVFIGSMLAYREKLMKKRLAYSTVSQVSYILFGLFLMNAAALQGAFIQIVAHSAAKNALFLAAGSIIHHAGRTRVDELSGIGKKMPVTLWAWTIGGLGLIGIPPTGGFVAKWQLVEGALDSGMGGIGIAGPIVLIISALLTAAYILSVTIAGFFPGEGAVLPEEIHEAGPRMCIPMILLMAATILSGIFAAPIADVASQVFAAIG